MHQIASERVAEFFRRIIEHSKAKLMHSRIIFDTQLKSSLKTKQLTTIGPPRKVLSETFINHILPQTEGRPSAKTVQGASSTPLASKPPPVPPT